MPPVLCYIITADLCTLQVLWWFPHHWLGERSEQRSSQTPKTEQEQTAELEGLGQEVLGCWLWVAHCLSGWSQLWDTGRYMYMCMSVHSACTGDIVPHLSRCMECTCTCTCSRSLIHVWPLRGWMLDIDLHVALASELWAHHYYVCLIWCCSTVMVYFRGCFCAPPPKICTLYLPTLEFCPL